MYADDSDFSTQTQVKDYEIKTKTNNILSSHSLKVTNNKRENTAINEEIKWRNAKKVANLLSDYEDVRKGILLSNSTIKSMNKIWPQQRLDITQTIYKTIVESVLTNNYSAWGLAKAEIEELNRAHRKQL